jgi:glutamate/tyrosine decarboxylase-like PLP-dependent enzyme
MAGFPQDGIAWTELRDYLRNLKQQDYAWREGRVPVYVYHYTDELARVSQEAYMEFFTENALGQGKAFPSVQVLENEIIDMAIDLLGGQPQSGGTFTSGGTESIFLAIKAARDWARVEKGIDRPKLVMPVSSHATASKAASYLDVEVVRTPLGTDLRADISALEAAIDEQTFMIIGSAPGYPHGVYDPIEQLGALAKDRGLWLHVDACVGGFLAPFVRDLGYPIPPFDLSVLGVSSLSADIHKYGFAAKGASLVLYADKEHQRYQRFEFYDWPRGAYVTETFQGTRAAGPLASAWAVMNTLGRAGYREIAKIIMQTKERLAAGIEQIEGLEVVQPHDLCILLYKSVDPAVDIYAVADLMVEKGWFVGRSITPHAIHIALNPVVMPALDEYLADLAISVSRARKTKQKGTINLHTY